MSQIDITKPKQYRTRTGRAVRLYANDGAEPFTIHGAFKSDFGWLSEMWMPDGRYIDNGKETALDLVEVDK